MTRSPPLGWAALALLACACSYDYGGISPCQIDRESCRESVGDWPTTATCTAKDPLTLQMGNGEGDFAPYTGETLGYHSSPGGGQGFAISHFLLGVRIGNPDPVHRKFKVAVLLPRCFASYGDASATAADETDFVLNATLKPQADGSLVRTGLRVLFRCWPAKVTVTVIDECGRTASDAHLFSHYSALN